MDESNNARATPTVPSEKNAVLIDEVKKFPALYDARDPNYYILARRNEAWLEVARNCREPGISSIYLSYHDKTYSYSSIKLPLHEPHCSLLRLGLNATPL